jgi:hypothetical protein
MAAHPRSAPAPVRPAPANAKKKGSKRAIALVAGLVLAVVIIGSFVSRQGLKASNKAAAASQVQHTVAPPQENAANPAPAPPPAETAAPQEPAPKPGESGPDDIGNPQFSAKQTLHGPVRSMWESGRYSEAMSLVNLVLAADPNNAEARSWKKKIHDAQQAEAALK